MLSLILKAVEGPKSPGLQTKPAPELSRATSTSSVRSHSLVVNRNPAKKPQAPQHGVHPSHLPRLEAGASDQMKEIHAAMSSPSQRSGEHVQKLGGHTYHSVADSLKVHPSTLVNAALHSGGTFDGFKQNLIGNGRIKSKVALNPKDDEQSKHLLGAWRSMGMGDKEFSKSAPVLDGLAWFDSRGNGLWKSDLTFGVNPGARGGFLNLFHVPALHAVSSHGLGTGEVHIHPRTRVHTAYWTSTGGKKETVGKYKGPTAATDAMSALQAKHTGLLGEQRRFNMAEPEQVATDDKAGTGVHSIRGAKKKGKKLGEAADKTAAQPPAPVTSGHDIHSALSQYASSLPGGPTFPKGAGPAADYTPLPGGFKLHRKTGMMYAASMLPAFYDQALLDRSTLRLMKSLASGHHMVIDYTSTGKPIYADGRHISDFNNNELKEVHVAHKDLADRMLDLIYGVGGNSPVSQHSAEYIRSKLVEPHQKMSHDAVNIITARHNKEFFKGLKHPRELDEIIGQAVDGPRKFNVPARGLDRSHKNMTVGHLRQARALYEQKANQHKTWAAANDNDPEMKKFNLAAASHYDEQVGGIDAKVAVKESGVRKPKEPKLPKNEAGIKKDAPVEETPPVQAKPPEKQKAGAPAKGTREPIRLRRMGSPMDEVEDPHGLGLARNPLGSMYGVKEDEGEVAQNDGEEATHRPSYTSSTPVVSKVRNNPIDAAKKNQARQLGKRAREEAEWKGRLSKEPALAHANAIADEKLDVQYPEHRDVLSYRGKQRLYADSNRRHAEKLVTLRRMEEEDNQKKHERDATPVDQPMESKVEPVKPKEPTKPAAKEDVEAYQAQRFAEPEAPEEEGEHHKFVPTQVLRQDPLRRMSMKSLSDNELALMILESGGLSRGGEINKPMNVSTARSDTVDTGLPEVSGTVQREAPAPAPLPPVRLMVGGVPSSAWDRNH